MIFVPVILFTSSCILQRIRVYGAISLAHILGLCFGLYYIALCVPTGILASAIIALMNAAITLGWVRLHFATELSVFVISWIFQFVGHGVFEKRKPALLDNLVQSLVLAPYFVLFEVLFKLGYMPQLRDQLEHDIAPGVPQ